MNSRHDIEDKFFRPSPYASVDPTPPLPDSNVDDLKLILLDEKQSLFNRYRAMFALRNINSRDAAVALAEGLDFIFGKFT